MVRFTPARVSDCEDASMRPSALHARPSTQRTRSGVSVKISRPLATSLILIERDAAAEASRLPSLLKAKALDARMPKSDFVGTGNERGSLAAFKFQSLTLTPCWNIFAIPVGRLLPI